MKNADQLDSIYVIILNYQSYKDTIAYVDCLQKQEKIDLNILIVDNCSPNKSYDILKDTFLAIKNIEVILSERNGGYAYGNNFGLHYLKKKEIDFIVISNNDISINDTLLLFKMTKEYKKLKNPAFVAPIMRDNGKISKMSAWKTPRFIDDLKGSLIALEFIFRNEYFYRGRQIYNTEHLSEIKPVDCLAGSFFMGVKKVFFDIGLLDENTFLYMEESIIGIKVKRLGLNNYLLYNLNYDHLSSQTISSNLSFINMHKYAFQSKMYYHKEYLNSSSSRIFLLKSLFEVWKIESSVVRKIKLYLSEKS